MSLKESTHCPLAILFASKALAPAPGPMFFGPLVALPNGACGTAMRAPPLGRCRGCMGDSVEEGVADIMKVRM